MAGKKGTVNVSELLTRHNEAREALQRAVDATPAERRRLTQAYCEAARAKHAALLAGQVQADAC